MKPPIHREGWIFIGVFVLANALLFLFAGWIGWLGVPFTLWCIVFFRDPERTAPEGIGIIVSPADGKLLPIVKAVPPAELGMGEGLRDRLSIFMNVFDVHVNRAPIAGTVVALAYRPGRFFNASFDKASADNERMSIRLRPDSVADRPNGTAESADIAVVQIAGLVARRIVCELVPGQGVRRGERFGMIRFGSRLDVYLPPGAMVTASPGQRVKAGESVLARFD